MEKELTSEQINEALSSVPGAKDLHDRIMTHGWGTEKDAIFASQAIAMFVIDNVVHLEDRAAAGRVGLH